jgi:hypothetical protein
VSAAPVYFSCHARLYAGIVFVGLGAVTHWPLAADRNS